MECKEPVRVRFSYYSSRGLARYNSDLMCVEEVTLDKMGTERVRDYTGSGRKNTPIWEGYSFRWRARTMVGNTSLNSSVCAVFSVYHGVVGKISSLYC